MESHIDFEKLVRLARLSLSPEEEISLRRDLVQMTAFAAVASAQPIGDEREEGVCPLREDIPHAGPSQSELLAPAPRKRDGFVCVPSVMEESDHA